jgi:hypothetical protein
MHANQAHFSTRMAQAQRAFPRPLDFPRSSFILFPPNHARIRSQSPQRHRFRLHHRLYDPEFTAKSSRAAFTMSDIDDELFALAGGDEDADVEEGEA